MQPVYPPARTHSPYPPPNQLPPRHFPTSLVWMLVIGTLGLFALPLVGGVLYYGYIQIFERIVPGVQVGETKLTWMRISEAATEINTHWNVERKLLVSDGFQTWQLYPAEMGLSVNGYRTAQNAYEVGRYQPVSTEIKQIIQSMLQGWQVVPVVNFDPALAAGGLEKLQDQATRLPTNASIVFQNGEFLAAPGELGYAINIEETLQTLAENSDMIMLSGYYRLPLKPLAPPISDVSAGLAEVERLLNTTTTIQAYDPVNDETLPIPITRAEVGSWLQVEAGAEGLQVKIDQQRVAEFLEAKNIGLSDGRYLDAQKSSPLLAQAIEQGKPLTLLVSHKPGSYPVQKGDTLLKISWKSGFPLWKLLEANPGLNPDQLYTGQVLIIPSKDEMLPLPVVLNKRIVISISKQRLMVYQDGKQINKYVISTGIDRSPTQPGIFQVVSHKPNAYASVWDLTMPNFLGIYEAWPGFMNGIHGLPMLSNGTRLWANILGRPASYGCIILDLPDSKALYQWAEDGVVVEIRP